MFYPVDLAAFYPIPPGGPAMWKVAGAAAILVALSTAAVIWRRRCPYAFVGWFWYLGMLFPTLGLVKVCQALDGRSLHVSARHRAIYRAGLGGGTARCRFGRGTLGSGRLCRAGDRRPRWPAPLGKRRFGATTRRCGRMPWHAPRTMAKPKSDWPTRVGATRPNRRGDGPLSRRAIQFADDYAPFNESGAIAGRTR